MPLPGRPSLSHYHRSPGGVPSCSERHRQTGASMIKQLLAIVAIAFAVAACGESPQTASLQQPPPAPPPPTKAWMVFFDTNSTTLSQQANTTVTEAAGVAKSTPNSRLVVTGYTDTEGSVAYNKALSLRRANAVRDALMRNGISPAAISVVGEGEQGLLVPTPDQTKNENNRRVQIVVQ